MPKVHLLDYVAGNVRSLVNAIEKIGYEVEWVRSPEEVANAEVCVESYELFRRPWIARTNYDAFGLQKLILPGVGHFGHCLSQLSKAGYLPALRAHIDAGKPFMGICVGLQALFANSAEDPSCPGLGIIPGALNRFDDSAKSVPHIGWNNASCPARPNLYSLNPDSKYYYVHSYKYPYTPGELESLGWAVATGTYGGETFVGAVAKGNVFATQFHPEKSGVAGLRVIRAFLDGSGARELAETPAKEVTAEELAAAIGREGLTRRVLACLDVRTNDQGDLVVTKGDQYDVREKSADRSVRNLGKPVEMAKKYYEQGADEVTFLNITSFRDCPVADLPMLEILRRTSETVFVPLTIGGGIRDTVDPDGTHVSALEIAAMYFKSGADKVSIGSDAVIAAEEYYAAGRVLSGKTAIEQISKAYGNQAVVVSVDPKRVYVADPSTTKHSTLKTSTPGPNGEQYCWYACTIKGGRETRDLDVVELTQAVEAMGAGEILLNCIDKDGTNSGFDLELIRQVKASIKIPVIASSGAGNPGHFLEVFEQTTTDAALGAGMFHRGEYTVQQVKDYLNEKGLAVRRFEGEL
jgi:glutamine amidotransferase/cyclase